jgi:hypothetical protein
LVEINEGNGGQRSNPLKASGEGGMDQLQVIKLYRLLYAALENVQESYVLDYQLTLYRLVGNRYWRGAASPYQGNDVLLLRFLWLMH